MIISYIMGGIGNQLWQYAVGRRLAHKLHTELKLDLNYFVTDKFRPYALNSFNITASEASTEEIQRVKQISAKKNLGIEKNSHEFMPEVLDYPDDVWLYGYWGREKYFADVADIIREEFTLKKLSAAALAWQEKILAADCSVSMHVRHGDYIYNPRVKHNNETLSFDYYRECVNRLKQDYPNLTVFVFSNNLQWCRENLRLNVPTEFICGGGLSDVEELHLMSLCKHNILANSTFSWWGAWLNRNPDKKVFVPIPQSIVGTDKTYRNFSAQRNENSPLDSDRWIRVPFDINKQPDVTMRPWFSLLLVVNNDAATLPETLGTFLAQDYKFFELIIIDNASYDGSNKICQQAAKSSDKVTLIKLYEKISNSAAWNMALNIAQGDSILFLKGNDRLTGNALSYLYMVNERVVADVVNAAVWIREDANGTIVSGNKKFAVEGDTSFKNLRGNFRRQFAKTEVLKIFAANANAVPIATKIFKRQFLSDSAIRFDENIDNADAELVFMTEAMLHTDKEMLFVPNLFYIAPKI